MNQIFQVNFQIIPVISSNCNLCPFFQIYLTFQLEHSVEFNSQIFATKLPLFFLFRFAEEFSHSFTSGRRGLNRISVAYPSRHRLHC